MIFANSRADHDYDIKQVKAGVNAGEANAAFTNNKYLEVVKRERKAMNES